MITVRTMNNDMSHHTFLRRHWSDCGYRYFNGGLGNDNGDPEQQSAIWTTSGVCKCVDPHRDSRFASSQRRAVSLIKVCPVVGFSHNNVTAKIFKYIDRYSYNH